MVQRRSISVSLPERLAGWKSIFQRLKACPSLPVSTALKELSLDGPFEVIGERINPTGKKALREELKNHCFDLVQDMAVSQVENGAGILDINVGMSGIDEKQMMLEVIDAVNEVVDVPLCIDSSGPQVVEAALRHYHGRALVNSVSCEQVKLEKLLPVVKKYGAMFIMLPLNDAGLPEDFIQRKENLARIMEEAGKLGFDKRGYGSRRTCSNFGGQPCRRSGYVKDHPVLS